MFSKISRFRKNKRFVLFPFDVHYQEYFIVDLMDFLKAEIERKKKQLQKSEVLKGDKKYFKRGELAAKQEEEYWQKHKRYKTEHPTPSVSRLQDEEKADSGSDTESGLQLPRKEVKRRLRERGEPIRLFGESDLEAYQRLKKLEILAPEINKGFRNDLKAAMDKVDADYLTEIIKTGSEQQTSNAYDVKVKDEGVTEEDLKVWCQELGDDDDKGQEILLKYFKYILYLWGCELNRRQDAVKKSTKGKLASALQSQTLEYLRPLFVSLKTKSTDKDILHSLMLIVKEMLQRQYLKANDLYYEMAIGNAPWPVGVTMVGIHARTGREKIFSNNVAHVLNDEVQRKYIQALKRLMTHAQRFFPTDPSFSVEYQPTIH
ncbi:unnamed protein product [Owenia fusiformis]|uniref:Pre-mRNA-splicing factor 18 n=1 Tax=Owenia fusiformis TaxID=6347 RepID=A0A8J1XGA0_OWEFU|nr:unnamed protein product [Owenia fusiformis]